MGALFQDPAMAAALAGVVIATLLAVLAGVRGLRARGARDTTPARELLLREGRYAEAAVLALREESYTEAIDYFLRAQEPARAAQVAARLGDAKQAAELYELAGDEERAAHWFEKAGLPQRAPARAARGREGRERAPGKQTAPRSDGGASLAAIADAQIQASRAAEEHLAEGNLRKAADVYRDAGLLDEAVHLYANVLGLPGEAAPLVAQRGHHERAAELYELAGMLERAAAQWTDVARGAPQPEMYLDRVERLSHKAALALLAELTGARPLDRGSAELHYRFGAALATAGEPERAMKVFTAIRETVGDYRDVGARMEALEPEPEPEPEPELPFADVVERQAPARSRPILAPTPPPAVVVQPVLIARDVTPQDVTSIALEAARAALSHARRSSIPPPPSGIPATRVDEPSRMRPRPRVMGLESAPLEAELLADAAVRGAREGPSIESLQGFIGEASCELQNIEVFYRLGLARLGAGQWSEALRAFEAVEEASPGYRDAERRARAIRDWQRAVGDRVSLAAGGAKGRYQLRGELGRGGMAVVYRALDTVLGRDVALKFLSEEYAARPEMRELFQREARSAARLNHPNVVTIYDFGVLEGRAFIAMEYVEGQSVEHAIAEQGRLSVMESLRITRQVLDALHYAHGQQIVHRDVKPSNMMRTPSGLVKLMDFGLAKSIAAGPKASMVAGTPAYMPPEQALGTEVDHRADLFAVGVSLYEMISGELPFVGMERSGPARSLRERVPSVPELLDRTLTTAMDVAPERRFPTAAAFAAPVRRLLSAVDRTTGGGEAVPDRDGPAKHAEDRQTRGYADGPAPSRRRT